MVTVDRCWICKRPAVVELQVELPRSAVTAALGGVALVDVGEWVLLGVNACRSHRGRTVDALVRLAVEPRRESA